MSQSVPYSESPLYSYSYLHININTGLEALKINTDSMELGQITSPKTRKIKLSKGFE